MPKTTAQMTIGVVPDKASLNATTKEIKHALGRITGNASEFQKSLDASTARVFAFGATTSVISGVATAFKTLVSTTIEVEKRMVEIGSIFDGTTSELSRFREEIFQVAKNTGQSFSTVADAAAEFARQGLSAAETTKRLNDALVLSRISGLDSVKSVKTLTAAINGYSSAGLSSTQITDKIVAVDRKFAVSAEDLSNAISRAASTAEDAGVSFDEFLGIVTAIEQKTARGGAVIGNGLKTIFTRIGRQTIIDDLQALGVAIDATQSGAQKLQVIGAAFEAAKGNISLQNQIKEKSAGVFQINLISAALKDLTSQSSAFGEATKTSQEAAGTAAKENAELQKPLSSQLNALVAGFTNLGEKIGGITLSPLLKGLTEAASMFGDFFNKALDPETGNKLIQGIFKSIGAFISGPGLILITTGFVKIIQLISRYAKEGFKSILDISAQTEKLHQIQSVLVHSLEGESNLRRVLLSSTSSEAEKQKAVTEEIKRTNQQLADAERLRANLAKAVVGAGIGDVRNGYVTDKKGKPIKASGFTPSFAETMAETSAAREHGYKAGKVFNTRLYDGTGGSFQATVNSAEKIKTVRGQNGKLGTYVTPPNGLARGYVPNYAGLDKNFGQISKMNASALRQFMGTKTFAQTPNSDPIKQAAIARQEQLGAQIQAREAQRIQLKGGNYGMLVPNIGANQTLSQFQGSVGTDPYVIDNLAIRGPNPSRALSLGSDDERLKSNVYKSILDEGVKFGNSLDGSRLNRNAMASQLVQNEGYKGAINSAVGAAFEASVLAAYPTERFSTAKTNLLNQFAGNFDLRGAGSKIQSLFNLPKSATTLDFKASADKDSVNSFVGKIMKEQSTSSATKAKATNLAKARGLATGFVPNFVSPNALKSLQLRASYKGGDPRLLAEAANARRILSKHQSKNGVNLRTVFDKLDGESGISQIIDQAFSSAGPTASNEDVFRVFESQTRQNPQRLRELVKRRGLVPNFSAVQDAIAREKKAGVPASSIYIDQNPQLKSPRNPAGLMVANRIDEPLGGAQGIRRARSEGKNPKSYGAGGGFVPNYAPSIGKIGQFAGVGIKEVGEANKALKDFSVFMRKNQISAKEAGKAFDLFVSTLKISDQGQKTLSAKGKNLISAYDAEIKSRRTTAVALKNQRAAGQAGGGLDKLSSGLAATQGALFSLSFASNSLLASNQELNDGIQKLIVALSVAQLLSGASGGVGKFAKSRAGQTLGKTVTAKGVVGGVKGFFGKGNVGSSLSKLVPSLTTLKIAASTFAGSLAALAVVGVGLYGAYRLYTDKLKEAEEFLDASLNQQERTSESQQDSSAREKARKSGLGLAKSKDGESGRLLSNIEKALSSNLSGTGSSPESLAKYLLANEAKNNLESSFKNFNDSLSQERIAGKNFEKSETSLLDSLSSEEKKTFEGKGEIEKKEFLKETKPAEFESFEAAEQASKDAVKKRKQAEKAYIDAIKSSKEAISSGAIETKKAALILADNIEKSSSSFYNLSSKIQDALQKIDKALANQQTINEISGNTKLREGSPNADLVENQINISKKRQELLSAKSEFQGGFFKSFSTQKEIKTKNENGEEVSSFVETSTNLFEEAKRAILAGGESPQALDKIEKVKSLLDSGELQQQALTGYMENGARGVVAVLREVIPNINEAGNEAGQTLLTTITEGAEKFKQASIESYQFAKNRVFEIKNELTNLGPQLANAIKESLAGLPAELKAIGELEKTDPLALFKKFQEAADLKKKGKTNEAAAVLTDAASEAANYDKIKGANASADLARRAGLDYTDRKSLVVARKAEKVDFTSISSQAERALGRGSVGFGRVEGAISSAQGDSSKIADLARLIQQEFAATRNQKAGQDILASLQDFLTLEQKGQTVNQVEERIAQTQPTDLPVPQEVKAAIDEFRKANPFDEDAFKELTRVLKEALGPERGQKASSQVKGAAQAEASRKTKELEDDPVKAIKAQQSKLNEALERARKDADEFGKAIKPTGLKPAIDSLMESARRASENILEFESFSKKLGTLNATIGERLDKMDAEVKGLGKKIASAGK